MIKGVCDKSDMTHKIHEVNFFSLKPQKTDLPRAELLFQNRETGIVIDGIVLEKQFSFENKYLLFLTEDCPFEEGLHIYLLDHELQILDGVELGGAYASAILNDVKIENNSIVSFAFFGQDRWRLQVASNAFRQLNISMLSPIKYKRGLYSRCWLKLERIC